MLFSDVGQNYHVIALPLAHWADTPCTKTPRCNLHDPAQKFDRPYFFPGVDKGKPQRLLPAKKIAAIFSTSRLSYPTCGSCAIQEPVPGTAFMPGTGEGHDSQAVDVLLMRGNTASGVWADAAYRSEKIETKLRARGFTSRIHRKGKMGKPLTEQARKSNKTKSSVRVRPSRACKGMHERAVVEHVFGAQTNDMGGTLVRTIGLSRAKAKIGMKNLAYNIRRLGQLRRINPFPA